MKPASAKAKGSRLERKIAQYYRRYLGMEAKRMPLSGADSMLKGDIVKRFWDGWTDECKNQERINIWDCWSQAREQAGNNKPVLHISRNNGPELTVIYTRDYFNLRAEAQKNIKELK